MFETGSYEWYTSLGFEDKFFKHIITSLNHADFCNSAKLAKTFPHLILSRQQRSWESVPHTDVPVLQNENTRKELNVEITSGTERGSFNWFVTRCGDFTKNLAMALYHADENNQAKIQNYFPEISLAFNQEDWDKAPTSVDVETYS